MTRPDPTLEVSIVMPCLNEAITVARCVREAVAAIVSSGTTGEVIVADNGSTDGSRELAAAAGARVVFGVILGTGVGAGIAIDGQAWRGLHGIAGEWGHNPAPRLDGDEPEPIEVVPMPLSTLSEWAWREDLHEARSLAALFLVRDLLRERAAMAAPD